MSSALIWWGERLKAGCPLQFPEIMVPSATLRYTSNETQMGGWPNSVAKQYLYEDYLWWFEKTYLKPYENVPYFVGPGKKPEPVASFQFFVQLQPFINPLKRKPGKYKVWMVIQHEGRQVRVKRYRNFFRLETLEEHRHLWEIQNFQTPNKGLTGSRERA